MQLTYITIAILSAVCLILLCLLVSLYLRTEAERKSLYNRLQAGTLQDYACNKPYVEPDKPQKITQMQDSYEESLPVYQPDTPTVSVGEAISSFNKLQGNAQSE
jgi:hypothetical protein